MSMEKVKAVTSNVECRPKIEICTRRIWKMSLKSFTNNFSEKEKVSRTLGQLSSKFPKSNRFGKNTHQELSRICQLFGSIVNMKCWRKTSCLRSECSKLQCSCTQTSRDHSFSTYAKFSEKLTFLTPWYTHVREYGLTKTTFTNLFITYLSLIRISVSVLYKKVHVVFDKFIREKSCDVQSRYTNIVES